jgi:hypothetical protein
LHYRAAISLGSHTRSGEALERRCRYPEEDCNKYQRREISSSGHDSALANIRIKDSLLSHCDMDHQYGVLLSAREECQQAPDH